MYQKKWYAGDIHQHSEYSSPLYGGDDNAPDTLKEVRDFMLAKGLSFGAASDHHNICNHTEWSKLTQDNFITIISKEISTTRGHVMALNCKANAIFNTALTEEEDLKKEYIRLAAFIKSHGGIVQLNHPREQQKSISFPESFTDITWIFDTMEVWNGSEKMEETSKNGAAFRLWLSLMQKGIYIPMTSGSDTHRIHENMPSRNIKTVVYTPRYTRETILQAIKSGNSFISSNPFIEVLVNGKCYGETAEYDELISVDIIATSPQTIDLLWIRSDVGVREIVVNSKVFQRKITLHSNNEKWLVFEIGTNSYNKAITNPIFMKRRMMK